VAWDDGGEVLDLLSRELSNLEVGDGEVTLLKKKE